jgi:cytochrome c oxidase cbb3-type subunit 3
MPGRKIFETNCTACHGDRGQGGCEFGAPKLADGIWLYGGDRATVFQTVYNARSGVMPYWKGRLDDATIRELTMYVYSLGGGEPEDAPAPAPQTNDVTTQPVPAGQ